MKTGRTISGRFFFARGCETMIRPLILLTLTALAAPVLAGAREQATVVMPSDARALKFQEEWGFSDAVVTKDGTVYISGVVVGLRPGDTDIDGAYERGFARVADVLKRSGASWNDVVDITTYHTDLDKQMPSIVKVKNRYVKAPFPAWTAVQVTRLVPPTGITEIKVVAKLAR
jgi:enamine deaminase RidA (YjgF/YER057c/UK114 family)